MVLLVAAIEGTRSVFVAPMQWNSGSEAGHPKNPSVGPASFSLGTFAKGVFVAKALIKVDVRSPSALVTRLHDEAAWRRTFGEINFCVSVEDAKRNVGYVILQWASFKELERFIESDVARAAMNEWPVREIFDVTLLRDIEASQPGCSAVES